MLQSNGMTSGPRRPGSAWVKGGGGGSKQCRRDRDLWGPGDDTSPPPTPQNTGSFLTWVPPPGSCGQRGEPGDKSKSLSSSASPSARGRFQGPGGGHGCSMSGCPRPYNPTANGLGVSTTRCAEPAAPAGWGRYPESLCPDADVRAALVPAAQPADGGKRRTPHRTSLPDWKAGPREVGPGAWE